MTMLDYQRHLDYNFKDFTIQSKRLHYHNFDVSYQNGVTKVSTTQPSAGPSLWVSCLVP